jgi:uncharacterized membrane protein
LYTLLKLAHVVGAVLIGGGLIGVWVSDLRSRQIRDLPRFSEAARHAGVPTFTHFLDLPLFLVIVSLGVVRPTSWALFVSGTAVSLFIAAVLSIAVPRMYKWKASVAN